MIGGYLVLVDFPECPKLLLCIVGLPLLLQFVDLEGWLRATPRGRIVWGILVAVNAVYTIVAFTMLLLVLAWPVYFAAFWPSIASAMETLWLRLLSTSLLAFLGVGLYSIRQRRRRLYGLAELAIGIALCWGALGNTQATALVTTLSVAGGVYVIVRGLDNVVLGWPKSATRQPKP